MPPVIRTPDEAPPLIFEWKRERGVRWLLAMWLLVVAAGHAAIFYLFRVTAAAPARKPPPQQSVVFLHPAQPEVRSLLSAVDDRFPGALLRPDDHSFQDDVAALAKATPPSTFSWAAHQPVLREFPQPTVPVELPGIFPPGEPLLPEEPAPAIPATAEGPAGPVFTLVIDTAQPRALCAPIAWPAALPDESWSASGSVPFMLGITPDGRPQYCLPVSPATGIDHEWLRRHLMTARFAPAATGGLQWLNVSVRW
jgi:hypothetical protein